MVFDAQGILRTLYERGPLDAEELRVVGEREGELEGLLEVLLEEGKVVCQRVGGTLFVRLSYAEHEAHEAMEVARG